MAAKKKSNHLQEVFDAMDGEGFDYCFMHYSEWKEIKDPEFHELRKAYMKAAKALQKYVEKNSDGDLV